MGDKPDVMGEDGKTKHSLVGKCLNRSLHTGIVNLFIILYYYEGLSNKLCDNLP